MINQLLPTLSYGDAVSNSAVNLMHLLREMGYKSNIYAENIHPKMAHLAHKADQCPKDQTVIYHHSTGSSLVRDIPFFKRKRILIYHNVTPSDYFTGYSGELEYLCQMGRDQLHELVPHIHHAIADSEYNRSELSECGYSDTYTCPIIVNYNDYDKDPDAKLSRSLRENPGQTNILFVGRIAPNKKQDDIIKTFYYYKNYIDSGANLFLVGSYNGMERYYSELQSLIRHLDLENDVVITGHIAFKDILAYYRNSDIFISMSEHEGFCVPIVEAMHFGLPIISYKSSAIPDTLGTGGLLVDEKNYKAVAELIHIVCSDEELRNRIYDNQIKQLEKFSFAETNQRYKEVITRILG